MLASCTDGHEMIAGELSDLAGEADAAIGEQNFGPAEATGVEQNCPGNG